MAFTTPPTATVGVVVDEDYTNVFSDNDNWFNGLLPAPGAANQIPISSSTSAAAWGFANTAQIADGAIGPSIVATGAATSAKFNAGAVTSGKLTSAVALALAVAGMVIWVRKASEIPSGWTRETNLDGRVPVAAGTTFGTTFVENTAYGSSWSHSHPISTITTSGPSATLPVNFWTHTEGSRPAHTHDYSTATNGTAWAMPMRAVVYARK